MTADVELLPLPELASERVFGAKWDDFDMQDYARANVAHHAAAKDAEVEALPLPEPALEWPTGLWLRNGSYVQPGNYYAAEQVRACVSSATEALRAENKGHRIAIQQLCDQAERLAEALREARDMVEDWAGYASEYFQNKHDLAGDLAKLDTALRDHDQG